MVLYIYLTNIILPFGNLTNRDIDFNFETTSNLQLHPPKNLQSLFNDFNDTSSNNDESMILILF